MEKNKMELILELLSTDDELRAKALKATTPEALNALLCENGIEGLSEDQIRTLLDNAHKWIAEDGSMTDAMLEQVAGGLITGGGNSSSC